MPGSSSVVSRAFLIDRGGGFDPFPVRVASGAVGEAAAGEAVAVGYFDGVDAGGVQCSGDSADVLGAEAVADGVHAVAQGDVLDEDAGRCLAHDATSSLVVTSRSATRSAAEVMMSRFPAYSGR